VDGDLDPGLRTMRWDGTNDEGNRVASGIYYCRLEALGSQLTRKLALVR
jgi:flagellar hook assembly protein FlgD